MITIDEILISFKICDCNYEYKLLNTKKRSYISVTIFNTMKPLPTIDTIIITKASHLPAAIHGFGLFVINDIQADLSLLAGDIVEFSANTEINSLFYDLTNITRFCIKRASCKVRLMNALIANKGIHSILQITSDIFNGSVALYGHSTKLIDYYKDEEFTDLMLENSIAYGYTSFDFFKEYNFSKMIDLITKNAEPIFYNDTFSKQNRRIFSKVCIAGQFCALLVIIEHSTPFNKEDLELSKVFAEAISLELQKNNSLIVSTYSPYESIMGELLNEPQPNANDIAIRAKMFNWMLHNNFYVMTIIPAIDNMNFTNSENTVLMHLRNHIEGFSTTLKTLYYDGQIVLLINLIKKDDYDALLEKLVNFLKDNELIAGLSDYFATINDFKKYYVQSKNILELGKKLNQTAPLYQYKNLYFYNVIDHIDERSNLKDFCVPGIFKIIEHDNNYNTDYYHTLYAYLIHNKNMLKTAKKLHIHRNTMAYRLEKFYEISGIDLDDGDTSYQLYFTYKILDMN